MCWVEGWVCGSGGEVGCVAGCVVGCVAGCMTGWRGWVCG